MIRTSAVLLMFNTAACGRSESARSDSAGAGMMTAQTPSGMAGEKMSSEGGMSTTGAMGGMGAMHSDSVATRAEADLAAFQAASQDGAVKLVPAHRAAVEALIADCEQMMRQMKMTPPAKWNRAIADLRQDLTRMTTANATALHAMMPAHRVRVRALLSMRHDMMKM